MDLAGPKIRTGSISSGLSGNKKASKDFIKLKEGDSLFIHKVGKAGEKALYDEFGNLLSALYMSCTLPEIPDVVKPGSRLFLMTERLRKQKASNFSVQFLSDDIRLMHPEKIKIILEAGELMKPLCLQSVI